MTNCSGFLLSYIRYGDHDAVLNVFTKEHGYRSFFVKGIYASSSRKKSYLFPLNELEISAKPAKEGKIQRVLQLEMTRAGSEEQNVARSCVIMFAGEFLHQVLRDENANMSIYSEIQSFLKETDSGNPNAHIALVFNFLRLNGLSPLGSERKFLNPESGSFADEPVHSTFDLAVSGLWKIYGNTAYSYSIPLSRGLRAQFLDSLMYYYQQHQEHFHVPDSLEVLRQVFE